MKNKIFIIIFSLMFIVSMRVNVYADGISGIEGSDNYTTLKKEYDKGVITQTVSNSSTIITLYGKSDCDGSSCEVTYAASKNSNFKDALVKSVTCSNGEKNIVYQEGASGKNKQYNENNPNNYDGVVYWSEDYGVTCTSESTGGSTLSIGNSSSSTNTSNGSSSSSSSGSSSNETQNSSTNTTGSSGNYSSTTTVNNENTGVNTYFMVLGLVAFISYIFMIIVKKYNLFSKNI